MVFNGLNNYKELILNPIWSEQFWNAFRNSLVFVAINLFIQNPLALYIAAILSKKIKGGVLYRTIFFAPATLSLVAVAFIWEMILNPVWGISKATFGLLGIKYTLPPLLGLQSTALVTLALISAWQYIGVPISLYFASLISIPDDLMESAAIDGATESQIFWKIKFPLVIPMVGIISLMTFLANFSAFDIVYAVKGVFAGPNFATDTLMTFFFRTFFGYYNSPSNRYMGATIAGTMMVVLLVGVIVYFIWKNKQETYQY
jgi:raffinose/stachyose/melibiose transport system permease protein